MGVPMRITTGLTLVAVAIFYVYLASGTWLITPDSTDYVEGAKSLARARGYLDATGAAQTLVPPGTSAVYALAAVLPSRDFFYFNVLTKLLTVSFIVLAYLVVRRSAGDGVALIVVLFLALCERLIFESTRILSDIPFSATFMLTLWMFPQDKLEAMPVRAALALGAIVACCYVMRMAGLFVYLGYVTYLALWVRKNRLRTIVLVSSVLALVAGTLWLRARHAGASHSYLQLMFLRQAWVMDSGFPGLGDWWNRIATNTATTLRSLYLAFSNEERLLPGGVVVCLLICGGLAAELAHRRAPLHLCFLGSYLPALLLPPYAPDHRYFLPILPLLALFAASGARMMSGWLPSDRGRRLFRLALVAVVVINPFWPSGFAFAAGLRSELDRASGASIMYRGHERFLELVERHRGSLTSTDVVATMHANILRYFLPAGTRVWSVPLTEDVETLYRKLRDNRTTELYCDKTVDNWRYLEPVIRTHAASFELVAENQAAAIYNVRP